MATEAARVQLAACITILADEMRSLSSEVVTMVTADAVFDNHPDGPEGIAMMAGNGARLLADLQDYARRVRDADYAYKPVKRRGVEV